MKLKKIFDQLINEKIINKYSIYKTTTVEYMMIYLNESSILKIEYNDNNKRKIHCSIISDEYEEDLYKKFLLYFYKILDKSDIDKNDFIEFFEWLKYEEKRKLLGINKKQAEQVFVEGVIDIHPKLKDYAYSSGYIHISVMSLSLKRPIIFKLLNDVVFPHYFCIKGIDIVTPGNYEKRFNDDFYLDCWYGKSSKDVYENRGSVLGGEAWGKSGTLCPIRHGSSVKISINKFWTPELYDGGLKNKKDDFFSCWVDIHNNFKEYFEKQNKLVVEIKATNIYNKEELISRKEFVNLSLSDLPTAVVFNKKDLINTEKYNNKKVTGYVNAYLEFYDNNMNIKNSIYGGRASIATQIDITGLYGLKIILYKEKTNI